MADDAGILLGIFGAAHGVRGEVRLKSFTEPPEAIADYGPFPVPIPGGPGGRSVDILSLRPIKGDMLVARLSGVSDRTAAEALTNVEIRVPRDQLPEPDDADDFYHADLIGLAVVDTAGEALGTIVAVPDFGAGDLLEVAPPEGRTVYLPFTRAVVPEVDLAGERVVVDPPAGLFSADGDEDGEDADGGGEAAGSRP